MLKVTGACSTRDLWSYLFLRFQTVFRLSKVRPILLTFLLQLFGLKFLNLSLSLLPCKLQLSKVYLRYVLLLQALESEKALLESPSPKPFPCDGNCMPCSDFPSYLKSIWSISEGLCRLGRGCIYYYLCSLSSTELLLTGRPPPSSTSLSKELSPATNPSKFLPFSKKCGANSGLLLIFFSIFL